MDLPARDAAARVGLSTLDLSQALASYVRSIMSADSPYDQFTAGDRDALNDEQQTGLQIFRGKGNCTRCHVGPTFTDESLHNTGVAWRDGRLADEGGGNGTFKTPTLREVARTAPYMHDGSLDSLQQVVEFYDRGGNTNPALDSEIRPLKLTEAETRALVAFLSSLTGTIQDGMH
jgi:cytochrome c peroxidase